MRGRSPPPPRARVSPLFGPFPACFSRARSRSAPPLSLADEPAPPASRSLSRVPSRWQTGPTGQPLHRPPRVRLTVVPSIAVPSPIPSPHRKVWHRPSSPLDRVLAGTAPAVRSRRRRCAALMPALCTSPAPVALRRSPPLGRL
jgi:hypothetical protein